MPDDIPRGLRSEQKQSIDELLGEFKSKQTGAVEKPPLNNKPDRKQWKAPDYTPAGDEGRQRVNSLLEDTVMDNDNKFVYRHSEKIPDYTIA